MIQHVHGGCKQDTLVILAGFPADDAGKECFSHPGVADQHKVRAVAQKREIEQTKNAVLRLDAALVVVEAKRVDAGLRLQPGALEAALDSATPGALPAPCRRAVRWSPRR